MIRLRVLGSLQLSDTDGRELRSVMVQQKRLAVLVYLAVAGGFQRRDRLLALFWPELDAEHARNSLSQAIRFLKRELGRSSAGEVVVTRGAEEVGVDPSTIWCDATAFTSELSAGHFGDALELYRGDFLDGFYVRAGASFDDWLDRERRRLRASASKAARAAAEAREGAGHLSAAVSNARRAVELSHPDERAIRDLLGLLDRLGDRAGALRAYEQFAQRLAKELDANPAAETMELVQRIRTGSARSERPADATFAVSRPELTLEAPDLERWRVERELARGGMGTVYLARDTRHGRPVAIKMIRRELLNADGVERFLCEIQITASLAHPHILPLIDSGSSNGTPFLVTPYIGGESLRGRLRREQRLGVADAIRIAQETADALDYAHRRGIVHRDIKPENILLADGHALIADFGVARSAVVLSGAVQAHETENEEIAGSPAYMSPEQAAGDGSAGTRSDIYSLGCVLHEMLSGELPRCGDGARDIRRRRPEMAAELAALISNCIARDPAVRPESAAFVMTALNAISAPTRAVAGPRNASSNGTRLAVLGAAIALAVTGLVRWTNTNSNDRLSLGASRSLTRDEGLEVDPALSPDGRTIAYAAQGPSDPAMRIYVGAVDGGNAVRVSGDLPGAHRFVRWSRDGSKLLFSVIGRGLYAIPKFGGAPRLLASDTLQVLFGDWSPDAKNIVLSSRQNWLAIQTSDGQRRLLNTIGGDFHSPTWSPDGRWIAYVALNGDYPVGPFLNRGPSKIFVNSADGGPPIQLTDGDHMHLSPTWLPDSKGLLFVSDREGGLDIYRLRINANGERSGPIERLTTDLNAGMISLSSDGKLLAYSVVTHDEANIWSIAIPEGDPTPLREAVALTTGSQHIESLSISKDGDWIAFDSDRGGNFDIYKMRLSGGEPIQLTRDSVHDFRPEWSPDARWIAYQTYQTSRNGRDVYVLSTDGAGRKEPVAATAANEYRPTWSPDGRHLVYMEGPNLRIVERLGGGRWSAPRPLVPGLSPEWSPDGRLIAYGTLDGLHLIAPDGTNQRLLLPWSFEHGRREHVIGGALRWSPDGKILFIRSQSRMFWAVPVSGGRPRALLVDASPLSLSRFEFATDGTRLYFTIANRQADVRIVAVNRP